jgi:hypothetical protein
MLALFVIMLIMIGQININLNDIKNNITAKETIQINGKEYKQVKEENIESGKKVYYIIKQEKSDVKNINIE